MLQRKAYRIFFNDLKRLLALSDQTVTYNANRVGKELAACISPLQAPSTPRQASYALGAEVGLQYVTNALRPAVRSTVEEYNQTAKLPVSRRLKAELRNWATQTVALLAVNSCSDIATWQAAGFAPSAEPSGTQLANAYPDVPQPSAGDILANILTASQRSAISAIQNRSLKHYSELATRVKRMLSTWAAQNGF